MINTGLIGCGKWGAVLKKKIEKHTNLIFVARSKTDYKKKISKVDWVFVATPDKTHFKIVKFLIKKKKNVFCEKPLAIRYVDAKFLFKLAKINNVKLYVNDVENFGKKVYYGKKNVVIRENKTNLNFKNILNRWFYHDFYLIFSDKKKINFKISEIKINNLLKFSLLFEKKRFFFIYNENSKKKKYLHNNVDLYKSKIDKLDKMILGIIHNRVDYKKNKKIALNAVAGIQKIRKLFYKNLKIKNI